MVKTREGERQPIPISARIVRQQAQQTIRNLVDAIVELVTNSDDSYRRLEDAGPSPSGKIEISVKRHKGGEWEYLQVKDEAEGMDLDRLLTIVTYGGEASGFEAGRSVRGMFGRGLKEATIALGEGHVWSAKDGKESALRIWWDEATRQAMREVTKDSRPTDAPKGTRVTILARNSDIKCPTFEKLYEQAARHYALREINENKRRAVFLTVDNVGGGRGRGGQAAKKTSRVKYAPPTSREIFRSTVTLSELGKVSVEIREAETRLDFSPYDPCSQAGLLIRTEGATLDISLFGYDNYDAARYFSGVVYCPGIARKVREGDYGLIDADRSGLQWKHPACIELYEAVRHALGPHIERKQKELTTGSRREIPESLRKRLNKVCALLNRLAREELEAPPAEDDNGGLEPGNITDLTVKPAVANAEPKHQRVFSVYLPVELVHERENPATVQIELQETLGKVNLLSQRVPLAPHNKYASLLTGRFSVVGETEGDKAYILAKFNTSEDIAEFHVRAPKSRRKREGLTGDKGGMFRGIEFNDEEQKPEQRVYYGNGVVIVYLNFPPVSRYLGPGGKGAEESQGSLLLAELVAEAFCREVARRKLPERPVAPGGEVDNYNRLVNELMFKHLGTVHKALVV